MCVAHGRKSLYASKMCPNVSQMCLNASKMCLHVSKYHVQHKYCKIRYCILSLSLSLSLSLCLSLSFPLPHCASLTLSLCLSLTPLPLLLPPLPPALSLSHLRVPSGAEESVEMPSNTSTHPAPLWLSHAPREPTPYHVCIDV